ncbi:hypothetical protein LIN78_07815 [Leeia sp. TBRC 13508]|uniref:Uncharacterized protein n=1 Tax=Leeia speluncae TaxID=2884804 RepID=A0ABS8D5F9_9NEIS|nr:hypothetical protein [Leeia speluncae]MCB6183451.1 hypothetical protein [Leeia speluncae]
MHDSRNSALTTQSIIHQAVLLLNEGKAMNPEDAINEACQLLGISYAKARPSEDDVLAAWIIDQQLFSPATPLTETVRQQVLALLDALDEESMPALVDAITLLPFADGAHYQPSIFMVEEEEKNLIFFLTNQGADYKFLPGKSIRLHVSLQDCECLIHLVSKSRFSSLKSKKMLSQHQRYLSKQSLTRWNPLSLVQ